MPKQATYIIPSTYGRRIRKIVIKRTEFDVIIPQAPLQCTIICINGWLSPATVSSLEYLLMQ